MVPADLIRGLPSAGLAGDYTPKAGLQRLLAGTGIQYRLDGNTLTIERESAAENPLPMAQASPEAPPAEPKPEEDAIILLPEITVTGQPWEETSYTVPNATTATKTDTPIMETPFSVKVVPQQVLQDQQVIRLDQALRNVAGVIEGQSIGVDLFTIRGFDSGIRAGLYRDGSLFPQALNSFSTNRETANLERIEVLKGPGSILFGRTEPGGIINLVTKQPLASPYYALQQQFGSFDFYRTTVDGTGPLTQDDTLRYRFNLAYENAGSFRDFGEKERVFAAPVLRWNIGPRTQATLRLEYQHVDETVERGIPPIGNRPAPVPRDRVTSEPGDFNRGDRILAGFNWSHSFNDRWNLKHRFYANLLDFEFESTGQASSAVVGPDGNVDRNQARQVARSDNYFTSVDLTGKVETWGLKHTLLFGGDYYRAENTNPLTVTLDPTPFNLFDPRYGTRFDELPILFTFPQDQTDS